MHLEIDDEARAEAVEARDYYAAVGPDLGQNFTQRLDQALARIAANPLRWPPYTHRTRRYLIDRFPYAVIYRVKDQTIRVLAVSHQHRRPAYWARRGG
ncbi:MAG: type II toxin-antitoxin system RelE/ParE family toxin [Betaproteobacteria bacterium]